MKGIRTLSWLWFGCICWLAGCGGTDELIRKQSVGTRSDVYMELMEKTAIPPGFADLRIGFSVKTHTSSFHILEFGTRGTPGYVLVINIDGHAVTLAGALSEENTLNEEPITPETGIGMRYRFQKELRLKAGTYKVFVMIPEDSVVVEKELRLEDGTRNEMVLEPIYATGKRSRNRRPNTYSRVTGVPNFYSHLSGLRILMNGKPL